MFEGSVSEQLHQFLTPRTPPPPPPSPPPPPPPNPNSLPLPLNFALHSPNFNFHPFDSYHSTTTHQIYLHHDLFHQKDDETRTTTSTGNLQVAMDLDVGRSILMDDHHHHHHRQWSNDELLALLTIRSNIDNCFHESTWEHVSRKLGEVGFRRTAEKCKEKFEEETRYFNHINYHPHHPNQDRDRDRDRDHLPLIHTENGKPDDGKADIVVPEVQEGSKNDETIASKKRKRKTRTKFELLKGYCEEIVKNMMIQQEEIHSKLLDDMLKREEEKIAKEECWKKQQMERLHKELEVMAYEQAIASDRQATIIQILNQITNSSTFSSSSSQKELQNLLKTLNYNHNNLPNSPSSSSLIQTHSSPNKEHPQIDPKNPKNPCLSTKILAPQDPNSLINHSNPPPSSPTSPKPRDDLGKRWPRDEVLALVNVRCSLYGNGVGDRDQSGKAPLWERISQGMLQMGYKRSAKRCKEKWENINKYFRKTKDVNKKRALDSRTCPYFHQLSTLYNQGGGNEHPEKCSIVSSENLSNQSKITK
ncbi:trihelix transcription factor GTL2-like [Cucurbita moschata]|uniref:Trihelix transcription factor GTL2-like n=1 Tax=Cucurbita moschata TaxID=3662 RepID=A0A6J1HB26_CUCMO|nr:trihelix transcription factor GTL2-like [Cucurbita moschata]